MHLVAFCTIVSSIGLVSCFDFGFVSIAVGLGVAVKTVIQYVDWCTYMECCTHEYVPAGMAGMNNLRKLESELNTQLHGQHLVIEQLLPALRAHIEYQPKKALVISMNGWTGGGKNYVTQMIIDTLFNKKSNSKYVKFFSGSHHFSSRSPEMVEHYREDLKKIVITTVKSCERSLFVIDEVDKVAPGVLDVVKPFLDFHDQIDRVDYRKAIFVFISNIGGGDITTKYLQLWEGGMARNDMRYSDFEPLLRRVLFDQAGGLQDSTAISGHLISLYLPFLPLEREHVAKCVRNVYRQKGINQVEPEDIAMVIEELEYDKTGRFSTSGCKRVHEKVDIMCARETLS